jgi:hypothetical protein
MRPPLFCASQVVRKLQAGRTIWHAIWFVNCIYLSFHSVTAHAFVMRSVCHKRMAVPHAACLRHCDGNRYPDCPRPFGKPAISGTLLAGWRRSSPDVEVARPVPWYTCLSMIGEFTYLVRSFFIRALQSPDRRVHRCYLRLRAYADAIHHRLRTLRTEQGNPLSLILKIDRSDGNYARIFLVPLPPRTFDRPSCQPVGGRAMPHALPIQLERWYCLESHIAGRCSRR